MALNTKTSIVDALKSKGLPSSYDSRAKLAAAKGIADYTGSAAQNVKLLGLVNKGAGTSLKASAPAATKAAAPSPAKPSQGSATGSSSDKPASVNAPSNKAAVIKGAGAATGSSSDKPASPVKAVISSGARLAGGATGSKPSPSAGTATYASSGVARTPAEKKALIAKVNASADGKTAKSFVDNFIPSPTGGVLNVAQRALGTVSKAARLALPSTSKPALPSSTKASPFASGKASPPTSLSTTVRTGQGSSVQSQPRPSRGLPAPSKALPAPGKSPPVVKAAVKAVAPKPAPVKPTGTPKAAPAAKVAASKPPSPPPVPKGAVAAKTPIKAAPGKTTVGTPKASNKAAPAAKPTPVVSKVAGVPSGRGIGRTTLPQQVAAAKKAAPKAGNGKVKP